MKRFYLLALLAITSNLIFAQVASLSGPDGRLMLSLFNDNGQAQYSVKYDNKTILEKSPLGFITNEGDFTKSLKLIEHNKENIDKKYSQDRIKNPRFTILQISSHALLKIKRISSSLLFSR